MIFKKQHRGEGSLRPSPAPWGKGGKQAEESREGRRRAEKEHTEPQLRGGTDASHVTHVVGPWHITDALSHA